MLSSRLRMFEFWMLKNGAFLGTVCFIVVLKYGSLRLHHEYNRKLVIGLLGLHVSKFTLSIELFRLTKKENVDLVLGLLPLILANEIDFSNASTPG